MFILQNTDLRRMKEIRFAWEVFPCVCGWAAKPWLSQSVYAQIRVSLGQPASPFQHLAITVHGQVSLP